MRKHFAIFFVLVMIVSLTACNTSRHENPDGDPSPQTEQKEVILYFANDEYARTGDEKLDKVIAEKRVIQYGDSSLAEAVVRELMKGTETEGLSTQIPATAKLLGVEVSDGTAFVNFAREGMNGGSLQETFTIRQIVKSLTQLENVDNVQFLVDGNKAETLMGHMTTSEPFESE